MTELNRCAQMSPDLGMYNWMRFFVCFFLCETKHAMKCYLLKTPVATTPNILFL